MGASWPKPCYSVSPQLVKSNLCFSVSDLSLKWAKPLFYLIGTVSGFSNPCRTSQGEKSVYKNSQECQKFLSKPSALAAPAKQNHRAARSKSHQTFELMRLKSNWVSAGRAGIQRGETAPSKTTGNCNSFCKQQR